MSAGDQLLTTAGDVILDTDGNLQLSDGIGDSCCCGSPLCGHCSDYFGGHTCNVQVVIAGVSLSCCTTGFSGANQMDSASASLDDTLTLAKTAAVCAWRVVSSLLTNVVFRLWAFACGSGSPTNSAYTVDVGTQLVSGTSYVLVGKITVNSGGNTLIFYGTTPFTNGDCQGTYVISNNGTGVNAPNCGSGGTMTVTLCI